jgi:hypothetical protein
MSLRAKLVLWYTAVFAVSGSLLCTALYLLITHALGAEADRFLDDEFQEVRQITRDSISQPAALQARIVDELRPAKSYAYFYRLYSPTKRRDVLVVAAKGLEATATACPPPTAPEPSYTWIEGGPRGKPVRVVSSPSARRPQPLARAAHGLAPQVPCRHPPRRRAHRRRGRLGPRVAQPEAH